MLERGWDGRGLEAKRVASGLALPPALCSWKEVTQTLELFPGQRSQASASWGLPRTDEGCCPHSRAAPGRELPVSPAPGQCVGHDCPPHSKLF